MPASCISIAGVVARPLVEPEIWREVNLVTVRGRPHSPALAAFVKQAAQVDWTGGGTLPENAPPDSAVVAGRAAPILTARPD